MTITIDEIVVADPPESWRDAGFEVGDDGVCRVGSVRIRLAGRERGKGIVGWSLRGPDEDLIEVDGVPTTRSEASQPTGEPAEHPNGVTRIDHVVLLSPDVDRSRSALEAIGLDLRREREGRLGEMQVRQLFFRLGEVILEVVGAPEPAGHGPASLWGLTHAVADIDATADVLGERLSAVRDAVQPGRRIATLRHRDLGMSVRTALISPHVRA